MKIGYIYYYYMTGTAHNPERRYCNNWNKFTKGCNLQRNTNTEFPATEMLMSGMGYSLGIVGFIF